MTLIPMPPALRFRRVEWTLDCPAQVNRSAYSRARQVMGLPGGTIMSAKIDCVPIIGERNMLAVRAFLAKLKGPENSFNMYAGESNQAPSGASIRSEGITAAGSMTMNSIGWNSAPQGLLAGQFIQIGTQTRMLTQDAIVGAGASFLTFHAPLRNPVPDDAVIEVVRPLITVSLVGSSVNWAVEPGQIYSLSLNVEEAF